jgi:hypothetical protein
LDMSRMITPLAPRIPLGRSYPGLILKKENRMTWKGVSELCLKMPADLVKPVKTPQAYPLHDTPKILANALVEIEKGHNHTSLLNRLDIQEIYSLYLTRQKGNPYQNWWRRVYGCFPETG